VFLCVILQAGTLPTDIRNIDLHHSFPQSLKSYLWTRKLNQYLCKYMKMAILAKSSSCVNVVLLLASSWQHII